MSLHYAVLGLLSNGSMSGHDLSTTFSRGAGQFWTVNADGVQRSLDRLVEADLVSVEACPERTYRSTRLGQSVLDDWMASDDEDVPRREVFLLRLSVAAGLGSDEVGVILRARISTMKGRLSTLMRAQKRQRSVEAIFPTELQRVTAEATLEHLIELARAEIDWAGALALSVRVVTSDTPPEHEIRQRLSTSRATTPQCHVTPDPLTLAHHQPIPVNVAPTVAPFGGAPLLTSPGSGRPRVQMAREAPGPTPLAKTGKSGP